MRSYREREPAVFAGLTITLIVLWLGFLVHRSPRFPGSLLGHSLGILGAALMLVPLAYMIVKRNDRLRRSLTRRWSMRTLLAWHIYAGILGPILVLLHTGHRFESPLGIALTATTLVVATSGFVGRFLMKRVHTEIRDLRENLEAMRTRGQMIAAELAARPRTVQRPPAARMSRWLLAAFVTDDELEPDGHLVRRAVRVAESRADLEFALGTHELIKAAFSRWLKVHIAISMILYALMGLHVWATIHFGLRWLT